VNRFLDTAKIQIVSESSLTRTRRTKRPDRYTPEDQKSSYDKRSKVDDTPEFERIVNDTFNGPKLFKPATMRRIALGLCPPREEYDSDVSSDTRENNRKVNRLAMTYRSKLSGRQGKVESESSSAQGAALSSEVTSQGLADARSPVQGQLDMSADTIDAEGLLGSGVTEDIEQGFVSQTSSVKEPGGPSEQLYPVPTSKPGPAKTDNPSKEAGPPGKGKVGKKVTLPAEEPPVAAGRAGANTGLTLDQRLMVLGIHGSHPGFSEVNQVNPPGPSVVADNTKPVKASVPANPAVVRDPGSGRFKSTGTRSSSKEGGTPANASQPNKASTSDVSKPASQPQVRVSSEQSSVSTHDLLLELRRRLGSPAVMAAVRVAKEGQEVRLRASGSGGNPDGDDDDDEGDDSGNPPSDLPDSQDVPFDAGLIPQNSTSGRSGDGSSVVPGGSGSASYSGGPVPPNGPRVPLGRGRESSSSGYNVPPSGPPGASGPPGPPRGPPGASGPPGPPRGPPGPIGPPNSNNQPANTAAAQVALAPGLGGGNASFPGFDMSNVITLEQLAEDHLSVRRLEQAINMVRLYDPRRLIYPGNPTDLELQALSCYDVVEGKEVQGKQRVLFLFNLFEEPFGPSVLRHELLVAYEVMSLEPSPVAPKYWRVRFVSPVGNVAASRSEWKNDKTREFTVKIPDRVLVLNADRRSTGVAVGRGSEEGSSSKIERDEANHIKDYDGKSFHKSVSHSDVIATQGFRRAIGRSIERKSAFLMPPGAPFIEYNTIIRNLKQKRQDFMAQSPEDRLNPPDSLREWGTIESMGAVYSVPAVSNELLFMLLVLFHLTNWSRTGPLSITSFSGTPFPSSWVEDSIPFHLEIALRNIAIVFSILFGPEYRDCTAETIDTLGKVSGVMPNVFIFEHISVAFKLWSMEMGHGISSEFENIGGIDIRYSKRIPAQSSMALKLYLRRMMTKLTTDEFGRFNMTLKNAEGKKQADLEGGYLIAPPQNKNLKLKLSEVLQDRAATSSTAQSSRSHEDKKEDKREAGDKKKKDDKKSKGPSKRDRSDEDSVASDRRKKPRHDSRKRRSRSKDRRERSPSRHDRRRRDRSPSGSDRRSRKDPTARPKTVCKYDLIFNKKIKVPSDSFAEPSPCPYGRNCRHMHHEAFASLSDEDLWTAIKDLPMWKTDKYKGDLEEIKKALKQ